MYDLILRGGTVVDGTGKAAFTADVAVDRGTIAFIGVLPKEATAKTVLNVKGHVIAPGFIDIHTHADVALIARPAHLPKIMQGVTTEVFTNCGLGFAPVDPVAMQIQRQYIAGLFGEDGNSNSDGSSDEKSSDRQTDENRTKAAQQTPSTPSTPDESPASYASVDPLRRVSWNWSSVAEFLAQYEQGGMGANIAYLIPHGAVRVTAMGMEERPATAAELEIMRSLVQQGMEEGAWGLSTGIWYAPMRAADRQELVTLCRTAGFFATHQRDYGTALFEATEESIAIAREAGVPLEIAHLQMNGPENADRAADLLALIERERATGVDITCDTYPYTAGSTFVQALLPAWAVDGGPEAILRRLDAPQDRERIRTYVNDQKLDLTRYNLVGASSATNAPFEGESFALIAERRALTPGDLVCQLLEEEELRACYIHHAAHEGNVRTIMQWDGQMVGSDGLHLCGKTHPRLYGTFPRVLGHYVRMEKVLTLEQAIYKMTGAPAARLGLKRRGLLQVGNAADIVVFDPATVADTATFDDPLRYPTGVPHVFVNGIAVKSANRPTGALPGQVLRRTDR